MLAFVQIWNGLRKLEIRIEVGIVGAAAITGVPAGVEGELHKVGEAHLSAGAGRGAARQRPERLQIDGLRAFGF